MSEIVADIKAPFKEAVSRPVKFIVGALIVLIMVMLLESWKPGLITGPIKNGLKMLGIGSGA